MTHTVGKGRKARGRARTVRAEALGEAMADRLMPGRRHGIRFEEYGPDGEIKRVYGDLDEGAYLYVVSGHGYAEPKMDWRERGVVPIMGWRESES